MTTVELRTVVRYATASAVVLLFLVILALIGGMQ